MAIALLLLAGHMARGATLYDATLGNTPVAQGWSFVPLPGVNYSMTAVPGGTSLQTNASNPESAGFFRSDQDLNRNIGYTLRFNVRIDAENVSIGSNSNDRAGFSVIALSHDLQGIELAFWDDMIFAQSSTFIHAEQTLVNTTQLREYLLTIQGSNYSLNWTGGSLSGPLRDYSAHPSGIYDTMDFLFLGDDTTSAGANILLGSISLQAIPEPGTWAMGTLLLLGLGAVKMRRSRIPA